MKKLEETVLKNGFTYNLICRTERFALYEQIDRDGMLAGHEMGLIKIGKAKEVYGTILPERELFFSDMDFGVTAWSVGLSKDIAIDKFSEIENRFKDDKEAK